MHLRAKAVLLLVVATTAALAGLIALTYEGQAAPDPAAVANELCIVAPPTPYDARSGVSIFAPRPVPVDARCPVCGMYPARSPRWAAQLIFKDGAAHFFDSPINLFVFLDKVERYNKGYRASDVAASYATDFGTVQWIDARRAFFVHGSSIFGPMRDSDLPAFADRKVAEAFARGRGGKVLTFGEITPDVLRSLNRNVHHRH